MIFLIFVIGGVVFLFGKGIVVVLLVVIFEVCGLKVMMMKFDLYINVDLGIMSLFQYGEVYVIDDGVEIDFDLGYYECFVCICFSCKNLVIIGCIYENVICKECRGDYLGVIVQVILYIIDEICCCIDEVIEGYDVVLVEIGGIVGDIELLLFLEVICQVCIECGLEKVLFMYFILVFYIGVVGELKIKLIQYLVKELCLIGIQLDVLLCCFEQVVLDLECCKIVQFINVFECVVISVLDVDVLYCILLGLYVQGLDEIVVNQLKLVDKVGLVDFLMWEDVVDVILYLLDEVIIVVVGKYVDYQDVYKLVGEVLKYGGLCQCIKVNLKWLEVQDLEGIDMVVLVDVDGILVLGGFGDRGFEGKVLILKFVCEQQVLYFGICYGMQVVVVDYVCNVVGLEGVNSIENDCQLLNLVIGLIIEWCIVSGDVEKCDDKSDFGGIMCLGLQEQCLKLGMLVCELYGKDVVVECYCYCYEFNNCYCIQLEDVGLVIVGKLMDDILVEVVELLCDVYLWFLVCQVYLEFLFILCDGYLLFIGFICVVCECKVGGKLFFEVCV